MVLGLLPQRAHVHTSGGGVGPDTAVPSGQPPGCAIRYTGSDTTASEADTGLGFGTGRAAWLVRNFR